MVDPYPLVELLGRACITRESAIYYLRTEREFHTSGHSHSLLSSKLYLESKFTLSQAVLGTLITPKNFMCISLFSPHNNLTRQVLVLLFYRWWNWGTEQETNLYTQGVSGTLRVCIQLDFRVHALNHYTVWRVKGKALRIRQSLALCAVFCKLLITESGVWLRTDVCLNNQSWCVMWNVYPCGNGTVCI